MSAPPKRPTPHGHSTQNAPARRPAPHAAAHAQPRTPTPAQPRAVPAAPPVYRPQSKPVAVQAKPSARPANANAPKAASPRPTAPPVYRPQPQPKVLQTKPHAGSPHTHTHAAARPPAHARVTPQAPPVYRPQATPKVLQTKKSLAGVVPREVRAAAVLPRRSTIQPMMDGNRKGYKKDGTPDMRTNMGRGIAVASSPGQTKISSFFGRGGSLNPVVISDDEDDVEPMVEEHAQPLIPPQQLAPQQHQFVPQQQAVPQVVPQPQVMPPQQVVHLPQQVVPLPQVLPQPVVNPQPVLPSPQEMMGVLKHKVSQYFGQQVIYIAVENMVRGPFTVTEGSHSEDKAAPKIYEVAASLGRQAAFVCVYSTNSCCHEYTATGYKREYDCCKTMSGLLKYMKAGAWYMKFGYVWSGDEKDGDEKRREIHRKSLEGIKVMESAGWQFI